MHQERQDEVRPGRLHESAVQHFSFQQWPLKHSDGVWRAYLSPSCMRGTQILPPRAVQTDMALGSHPGINTNWEKYPTNFLKVFLVFLISGSSSLLQSQTLSQKESGGGGGYRIIQD